MSSYPSSPTTSLAETLVESEESPMVSMRQATEAFLVFDVEATCVQGTGFDYPNEIIVRLSCSCSPLTSCNSTYLYHHTRRTILRPYSQEFPVVLLKWADRDATTGHARTLVKVDEFRSYVRPTWRPALTDFCTALTGITQVRLSLVSSCRELPGC